MPVRWMCKRCMCEVNTMYLPRQLTCARCQCTENRELKEKVAAEEETPDPDTDDEKNLRLLLAVLKSQEEEELGLSTLLAKEATASAGEVSDRENDLMNRLLLCSRRIAQTRSAVCAAKGTHTVRKQGCLICHAKNMTRSDASIV